MGNGYRRRNDYQSVFGIKVRWYLRNIVFKMYSNSLCNQLIGEVGCRFIIARHVFAYVIEIPGQGTHTDAADSNKINMLYLG